MKLWLFINISAAEAINPIIAGFSTLSDACNHELSLSLKKNAQIIVIIISEGMLTAIVQIADPITP